MILPLYRIASPVWRIAPTFLKESLGNKLFHPDSLVSRLFPNRMKIVGVKWGIAKGMRMSLNLRYERHYFLGIHELGVQRTLAKFVRPGMNAYNLGAHIGFFALALINLVKSGGEILAFEPHPQVRERLVNNIFLNGLKGRVRVEDCAIGDFDGPTNFSLGFSDTQGRFEDLSAAKPESSIRVNCRRLDTYVEKDGPPPDFILMDVEHAEGRVFRGMARILERYRPVILVEMHGPDSIRDAWIELGKHDYLLASIPDLKVLPSWNGIHYGHYLAAPRSFFDWKEL